MKSTARLLSVLVVPLLIGCANDTVTAIFISDQQEVEMGENFVEQIEADTVNYPLYEDNPDHDPDLVDYVDELGRKLASSQDDRTTIDYHFTIIDKDSVINAFAVPGGFIYIYTGLIKQARDEAEISGVLAHELGHITKRHGAKRMVNAMGIEFVLDLVVGKENALRTALDLGSGILFLKYSRDDEYQADSCAVEYSVNAHMNPLGMKTFLKYLASLSEGPSWDVLSTHPPSEERADSVQALIDRKYETQAANWDIPEKKVSP